MLAVAQRRFDRVPASLDDAEQGLNLLGLVALIDPPRPEAEAAVEECRGAGITPVMITGDHLQTAVAVAAAPQLPLTEPVRGVLQTVLRKLLKS